MLLDTDNVPSNAQVAHLPEMSRSESAGTGLRCGWAQVDDYCRTSRFAYEVAETSAYVMKPARAYSALEIDWAGSLKDSSAAGSAVAPGSELLLDRSLVKD